MPELPEIECLTNAVKANLKGDTITAIEFFRKDLRTPIPKQLLLATLRDKVVEDVVRRSKYLLMKTSEGYAIFHMGMTGNLLLRDAAKPELPHTHVIFSFSAPKGSKIKTKYLHFVDPRRFGLLEVMGADELETHPLLCDLGPEPLATKDLGLHLFNKSRGSKRPIKNFIMDQAVVVGVGNIYASESLFRAKISPFKAAGKISAVNYKDLARCIVETLKEAIKAGGTTFRDFKNTAGQPGYFAISLNVYDQSGKPCLNCGQKILKKRQAGRSTFYCKTCQK